MHTLFPRFFALSLDAGHWYDGTINPLPRRRRHGPVVEDLHWIDQTSEAYLRSLVERLVDAPLLLLGTSRPGDRPPWGEPSDAMQVALRPLGPREGLVAHLGEAYLLAGRSADASPQARQALERARDLKQRGHEAYALRLLGEIAAQHQPPAAEVAAVAYRHAMTPADALGMRPLAAHCHLGLGTLYAQTRRPEPARAELSAAMALSRAMDMTFWLSRAEAALARVESAEAPKKREGW
jgi:hypothetical protein